MTDGTRYPLFVQTVLDCTNARELAEFYRGFLGLVYRPGDETNDPAGDDWLVLRDTDGTNKLAFQQVDDLKPTTWPDDGIPQQLHLDLTVATEAELLEQHDRAISLGARMVLDRITDPQESLRVYADPAGHPFCVFVAPNGGITR